MFKYNRKIEIKYTADVVVVGGGSAGTFAAIAAARSGAETILIEKNGILGGVMTIGGCPCPGLFFAWGKQIIDGPCWESILKTVELGGAVLPEITRKPLHHWYEQITLNKAIYAHVLDKMCAEANINVLFHSMPADVIEDENGIMVITADKDGIFAIRAKSIIDATGDANIAHMMNYECEIGEIQQPATLGNRLSGYVFENIDTEYIKECVKKATECGELTEFVLPDEIIRYLSIYRMDIHEECVNCADSLSKGKIEVRSREKIINLVRFLRKIKGLENLTIAEICDETGIRETRRIAGITKITANDYVTGKIFDDAICYAFYPIDLHVMEGIEQEFLKEDIIPTIPLNALIPKNSSKLLVCGRCLSSDNLANSGLRVQAACMAMGQAAGCAAAQMSREHKSVSSIDFELLCKSLKKIGAIVPGK